MTQSCCDTSYNLYLVGSGDPLKGLSGCVLIRFGFPEDPFDDLETHPCPQRGWLSNCTESATPVVLTLQL